MSKRFLFLLLVFMFTLGACAQAGESTTASPTLEGASEIAPSATLDPAKAVDGTPLAQAPVLARCMPGGAKPTPNPTVEALLPSSLPNDWVKGPEDAVVSFIEYSDFQ